VTLSLVSGPAEEPLIVQDVATHLRFPLGTEDGLLDNWITAAREAFEHATGRQLLTATWECWRDEFPCGEALSLPKPPLQEVVSVQYVDTAGTLQTWAPSAYVVIAPQGPYARRGRLRPVYGAPWPQTRSEPGAVRIQFKAGYGDDPTAVPELAKTALYLFVAHFHRYRAPVQEVPTAELPLGLSSIVRRFLDRERGEPVHA